MTYFLDFLWGERGYHRIDQSSVKPLSLFLSFRLQNSCFHKIRVWWKILYFHPVSHKCERVLVNLKRERAIRAGTPNTPANSNEIGSANGHIQGVSAAFGQFTNHAPCVWLATPQRSIDTSLYVTLFPTIPRTMFHIRRSLAVSCSESWMKRTLAVKPFLKVKR